MKFTRTGKICVALSLIHTSEKQGEYFHVSVQDTGIGIEHEDVPQIFEPFIQGEATSTREYGGSGLGLAIVKNLVELMGEILR
ncbi:ATP-binding protein [Vibrio sp. PP-XX7]